MHQYHPLLLRPPPPHAPIDVSVCAYCTVALVAPATTAAMTTVATRSLSALAHPDQRTTSDSHTHKPTVNPLPPSAPSLGPRSSTASSPASNISPRGSEPYLNVLFFTCETLVLATVIPSIDR
jgi:hypothetical protein